ncbi:MAG: Trk system potassium transporter TrkA [Ilumatobacter sp.]|uniref:Trk system potassium transporter TrkA n=1 Tax=Ilumatobacter sp. TaxID=1967498 RepID=UPI002603F03C|nr:Trk system potassium transporter TrkA [Ilumatobacter sp.]MDJ0768533.1 Trk system potassium transporter TrkA [Ilumatobacter sp.]
MHVVIIGAGEVGWYLAQRLGAEHHDVVVIEQEEVIARALGDELDVQTVVGSGTHPSVLRAARVERADLVAGVTQDDEVNMIASALAKQLGAEQTVVRLQTDELRGPDGAHLRELIDADLIIDPDADTAEEILRLVSVSGADEVYPMATGGLVVLGATIGPDSPMVEQTLADISSVDHWRFLFGAVTRDGQTVIPRGDLEVRAGDHVRVLTHERSQREVLEALDSAGKRVRRVMVLGGGAVGGRVAEHLVRSAEVTLVERDRERATALAERLKKVTVVEGEITDTNLLSEESVATMDVVIAATGEDTANVLACAFAAAESSAFTVAVLHRLALLPLIRQFGIDAALSPRTASANSVLRQMRGGASSVATFLESDVEVDEFVIQEGSPGAGAVVRDLHLPRSVLLGAVVRHDGSSEIVRGNTTLHAGESVVLFARPAALPDVRRVFAS